MIKIKQKLKFMSLQTVIPSVDQNLYTVILSSNLLSLEGYLVQGHIKVSGTVDYIRKTHAIKTLSRIFRVDG